MPEKQRTVAIIPARGGSKAIPKKNIKILGGIPLIAWPIKLAQSIPEIDRVIVSSDDDEIIVTAKKYNAEVLFKRPKTLSEDNTPTLPVLQHAIQYLEEEEKYKADNVVLLYATTPFLKKQRIEEGIKLLTSNSCDSVVGVRKVHGLIWKKDERTGASEPFYPKKRVNRQLFTHLFEEAGNIYLTKTAVLLKQDRLINDENCCFIEIEEDEMMDIDMPEDFLEAQNKVKELHL